MTQRLTHIEARAIISEAFRRCFGREPTRVEAQCVQGIGLLETGYGGHWSAKVPGAVGSNNWGAITAPKSWTGDTFEHRDSKPTDKPGVSDWYVTRFKRYPTPIDGATDLVRTVYLILKRDELVFPHARTGNARGVSTGLYDTKYYTGFGVNRDERIDGHYKKLVSCLHSIAKGCGEPFLNTASDAVEVEPVMPRIADLDDWLQPIVAKSVATELDELAIQQRASRDAWLRGDKD